jgi:hypothetical protein
MVLFDILFIDDRDTQAEEKNSFFVLGLYYKSFTVVIYDRNDSSQYY